MGARLLVGLAAVAACLSTALVGLPAAHADSMPPFGTDWQACTDAADEYCVVSMKRNGSEVDPGDALQPYVDALDPGTIRYGVLDVVGPDNGDVPPGDTYTLVVRSGTVHPRELYGEIRDVDFTIGGGPVAGYTFSLTFKPTPLHHVGYSGDPRTCTVMACGDDTWEASLDYEGFVTGYVTDLGSSGLSASEINWRTGMIRAYNAQDENTYYDTASDSFVIKLANPHLTGPGSPVPGSPATGSYEAFLPNAYLTFVMNVPDPSTLTGGSFTVARGPVATPTYVPFTLEHFATGIKITIPSITYSRPVFRIKPRPTAPGRPRAVVATKTGAHTAQVKFARPLATGGRAIAYYQARCRKASGGGWHYGRRNATPVHVATLRIGPQLCQVRAHNVKGFGKWSALDRT